MTCDCLVVGLNFSASVGRLEGPGRLVPLEAARPAVLTSLADVCIVTILQEDQPIEAMRSHRLDRLA